MSPPPAPQYLIWLIKIISSSDIGASLTYLNFCVGVTVTFLFMPIQTALYARDRRRHAGRNRPEARFLTSLVTVWLFPISLFWFAFTSNGNTSFWSPVGKLFPFLLKDISAKQLEVAQSLSKVCLLPCVCRKAQSGPFSSLQTTVHCPSGWP